MSAALDLFSRYGYAGSSVRHIAKEVGIRESAIYNHFDSKETILSEILEEYSPLNAGINLLTEDLLNKLDSPRKFLITFSEKLLNHWNNEYEKKILRLLVFEQFRDNSTSSTSLKKLMKSMEELWEIIFNEMKKLKIIKNIDSKVLSSEFVAVLFFIRIEFLSVDDLNKIQEANQKLHDHINFFWKAISGE